jgi:hypothetical protein
MSVGPIVDVNPDAHHILSADKDNVILLGQVYSDETGDWDRCVVVVARSLYLAAISTWLDEKAIRCTPDKWVGVGYIQFRNAKVRAEGAHLFDRYEDRDWHFEMPVNVTVYEAAEFEIGREYDDDEMKEQDE